MAILRLITIFLSFLTSLPVSCVENLNLVIQCGESEICQSYKDKILFYYNQNSAVPFEQYLAYIFRVGGILYPSIIKQDDSIVINFKIKPRVHSTMIKFEDSKPLETLSFTPHSVGEILTKKKIDENIQYIRRFLNDQGYVNSQVNYEIKHDSSGVFVSIVYKIKINQPIMLTKINILTINNWVRSYVRKSIRTILNKPYSRQTVVAKLEAVNDELKSMGFWMSNYSIEEISLSKKSRILNVSFESGKMFGISFEGSARRQQVINYLKEKLFRINTEPGREDLELAIADYYKLNGYYNPQVQVRRVEYVDKHLNPNLHFFVKLNKGVRTSVRQLNFKGNVYLSDGELEKLYFSSLREIKRTNYFDPSFTKTFNDTLKKTYIKLGFVTVTAPVAKIFHSDDGKYVDIYYSIKEGERAIVYKLNFEGIEIHDRDQMLPKLKNVEGGIFNATQVDADLNQIKRYFLSKGYYYVSINENPKTIVKYSEDYSSVELNYLINKGQKYVIGETIVAGIEKTQPKVINRNLSYKKNDILRPEVFDRTRSNLGGTGLFSQIKMEPILHESTGVADILLLIEERDFGSFEIAPGFRTDIGAKLSTDLNYSNLFGLNHSIALKTQINQRLNYSTLDERRRSEQQDLLEYFLRLNYNAPKIADSENDLFSTVSFQRRRFFSFDADIRRIGNTLKRQLSDTTAVTFKHQLERIEQFDATSQLDNGQFVIGAITPGVSLDFRDNPINPLKGAWFNLSAEYATPDFLSDKDIKFVKWVARNRFYIPLPNGVLATSLTIGVQENLSSSEGSFIPNIKVFRLAGTEIVRGYDDTEINRIKDGTDISEVIVRNQAFMTNLKIEPRFFINDTMMWGVFFDAGRVSVDTYNPFDLRTAVGFTFKYLTPVGSLDFDYGIKLLRKELSDGSLESPGRLHISIGFF
jgi:outer membrane protein insertion porin family